MPQSLDIKYLSSRQTSISCHLCNLTLLKTDQFFDFTNNEAKGMFTMAMQHFIDAHNIADPTIEIYRVLSDGKKELRFRLTPTVEH